MCKHPRKGFIIGKTVNGKDLYKIVPYKTDHVYMNRYGDWYPAYDSFRSSLEVKRVYEFTEIPCGKCSDCLLQRSRQWADRCMLELKYHNPNECWFITLTYDDDHIHKCVNYETGEIGKFPGTLVKSDFQDFMKRLRDHLCRDYPDKKIRFFMAGEYGKNTFRPHYHVIIYSLPLDDLKPFCKSKLGYQLFESEYVEKIWKNGRVLIGKVTWDTCAYTARYVLKKATGGATPDDYIAAGAIPEFTLMSRKPGIGGLYFDENYKKIYETDEIFFSQDSGGRRSKPSRYFDKRLERIDEKWYKEIKKKRIECAKATKELKLLRTDLDYEQLLEVEEKVLNGRISYLKREVF